MLRQLAGPCLAIVGLYVMPHSIHGFLLACFQISCGTAGPACAHSDKKIRRLAATMASRKLPCSKAQGSCAAGVPVCRRVLWQLHSREPARLPAGRCCQYGVHCCQLHCHGGLLLTSTCLCQPFSQPALPLVVPPAASANLQLRLANIRSTAASHHTNSGHLVSPRQAGKLAQVLGTS